MTRRFTVLFSASCAFAALAIVALPGSSQERREEQPLPERGTVIEIDSPERSLYKIAVPNIRGSSLGGPGR